MYSKDLERLVRTLHRQRCDAAYIRFYLQETYRVTDAIVDQVFAACGVGQEARGSVVKTSKDMMGGGKAEKPVPSKVRRSDFF